MGCVTSREEAHTTPRKTHDVCVTSTSPVLSPEDFASFFSIWIMRTCGELKLSSAAGRPQLGPKDPKPGSREQKLLRLAVLASRVAVCIVNLNPSGEWPPEGYHAELAWAEEHSIPVVPFYDADRYTWKEVCSWKVELPALFRSGHGPIRYHRNNHELAKSQLTGAIQEALREVAAAPPASPRAAAGTAAEVAPKASEELSAAERRLLKRGKLVVGGSPQGQGDQDNAAAGEETLGLQRSDYERAGLLERQLERTNSLADINIETALAMLAKRQKHDLAQDVLAPRDGGCRLVFVDGCGPDDRVLLNKEPAHKVLAPAKGILKHRDKPSSSSPERRKPAAVPDAAQAKRLRLAPIQTEERRYRFAVQQLLQHLESLRSDDVHELMTVQRCLQYGVEEEGLVVRALRLLSAFLTFHKSLYVRAVQQGAIPAIVAAMRRHPDLNVLAPGMAALLAILAGTPPGGSAEEQAAAAELLADAPESEAGGAAVVARSGAPEVVAKAMRDFPTCELLQEHGCRCLGFLCRAGDANRVSAGYRKGRKLESNVMLRSQARRLIVRHGGVEVLLEAMRRFPANAQLQVGGCMALGQIGGGEVQEKRRAAKKGGAVSLLLATLAQHPSDASIQRWGCAALRQLASHSQENKTSIAKAGGIEKLCDALQRFSGAADSQVAAEAIGALCHLASKHPENKHHILEAGGLELAVKALQAEPGADVAMAGCGLLHNLACHPDIKRHVVKFGGRELAEQLSKHEAPAVCNLATVLQRTLAPEQDTGGDPFGALFATRVPGLAAARQVSRRGRKQAAEAVSGARADTGGDQREGAGGRDVAAPTNAAGDDQASESSGSEASAASAASATSASSSAGGRRRPGRSRRQQGSARRFARTWGGGGGAEGDGKGGGANDDAASAVASDSSDADSHLSLEANEYLMGGELADAVRQLGGVRIRKEESSRAARAASPQGGGGAAGGGLDGAQVKVELAEPADSVVKRDSAGRAVPSRAPAAARAGR